MEGIELMVWDKATLGYLASPTKMKLTPQPRIPDPNPIPDSRFPILRRPIFVVRLLISTIPSTKTRNVKRAANGRKQESLVRDRARIACCCVPLLSVKFSKQASQPVSPRGKSRKRKSRRAHREITNGARLEYLCLCLKAAAAVVVVVVVVGIVQLKIILHHHICRIELHIMSYTIAGEYATPPTYTPMNS